MLALFFDSKAQSEIDSLRGVIPSLEGKERIEVMLQLANRLRSVSPDEASLLLDSILEEIEGTDNYQQQVTTLVVLSTLQMGLGKLNEAVLTLDEAESIAKRIEDQKAMADIQLTRGNMLVRRGNYDEAIEAILKGLDIAEAIDDKELMSGFLMNVGYIYQRTGNLEKATSYLSQAAEISQTAGLIFRQGQITINLGLLEYQRNNLGLSIEHSKNAVEIFRKINDKAMLSTSLQNLGFGYSLTNKFEKALDCYEEAIQLKEALGDLSGKGELVLNKAKLWKANHDPNKALLEANEALQLAQQSADHDLRKNVYYFRYEVYMARGNSSKALKNYQAYALLKDSIEDLANEARVEKLVALYESEEKNKALEMSNERLQMAEQEKRSLRTRQLIMAVAILLLLLLLLVLFFVYRSKSQNARLKQCYLSEKAKRSDLERRRVEHELEMKEIALNNYIDKIKQKNELIASIEEQLDQSTHNQDIADLANAVERKVTQSITWEEFRLKFDEVHRTFASGLITKHSSLTNNELDVCMLIKINLSNKEIARTLNMSYDSVKKSQQRLNKKIGLESNDALRAYLLGF